MVACENYQTIIGCAKTINGTCVSLSYQTFTAFTVEKDNVTASGNMTGLLNCSSPTTSCWYHPNNVPLTLTTVPPKIRVGIQEVPIGNPIFYTFVSVAFAGTWIGICVPMGYFLFFAYKCNESKIDPVAKSVKNRMEMGCVWIEKKYDQLIGDPVKKSRLFTMDNCCRWKVGGRLNALVVTAFIVFVSCFIVACVVFALFYAEPKKNVTAYNDCKIVWCNMTQTIEYQKQTIIIRNVTSIIIEKDGFTASGVKENLNCLSNTTICYYHPRNIGLTLSVTPIKYDRSYDDSDFLAFGLCMTILFGCACIPFTVITVSSFFTFSSYRTERPQLAARRVEYMLERNEEEIEKRKAMGKPIIVIEQAPRFSDIDIVCQDNSFSLR